jgi:hypothetical protein
MEIPLWIILIPLAAVVALSFLFLMFNVFHLARYGIKGRGASVLIALYLLGYAFVFVLGVGTLLDVQWKEAVGVKDLLPFTWQSSTSYDL